MSDQINVTFKCQSCGGTVLELPDDYTDLSIAKCKGCGIAFSTYGEIKAKAMDLAKKEVNTMFKKAFKGIKGFNIK